MTGRPSSTVSRTNAFRIGSAGPILALLLAAAAAAGCASGPGEVSRRDGFPLDPREDLAPPFPEGVERGWRALLAGDAPGAAEEFALARKARPSLAAEIGLIEAWVESDRAEQAVRGCVDLLASGEATLALLAACGEARARMSQPIEAWELYERALARDGTRSGLRRRAEELKAAAIEELLAAAIQNVRDGKRKEGRSRLARALELAPGSARARAIAGEIEASAGDTRAALRHYREAVALDPEDRGALEKVAELAFETGDYGLAVSSFEALAREDARFRERAGEARLAFRVSNWPDPERRAARAKRLSRAGAAALVWWMFPEIREARVRSGVVATDVLERRDRRALMRAVALGLLEVERGTHRARPDATLARGSAARLLLRLLRMLRPPGEDAAPCLGETGAAPPSGPAALRIAGRCGLLAQKGSGAVSGAEFTRALDRIRSLVAAPATPDSSAGEQGVRP